MGPLLDKSHEQRTLVGSQKSQSQLRDLTTRAMYFKQNYNIHFSYMFENEIHALWSAWLLKASKFATAELLTKNKSSKDLRSFVIVQSVSRVWLFVTPWTAACQASLSFTISQSLLKLMSTESVMPSNHLIFCCYLLFPSNFPSIRVFSSESTFSIRWPKYWHFSFSNCLSSEYSRFDFF